MRIGNIFSKIDRKYKSHKFSNLNFDSRKCKKGDIFFAIKGSKINGNQFIKNAIKNGANTVVSEKKYQGFKKNILFLTSKNPRKILSESAAKFFKKKPNNLVAVTGTNGKSSVANFYYQILKLNNIKAAFIGTLGIYYNNKFINTQNTTTDPITLNQTLQKIKKSGVNNVIMEASSHGLKQNRLDGIRFKTGVFTNLSRDHLDYHSSYKDYFNSKMLLFKNLMHKKSCIIYDKEINVSNSINKTIKNKNLKTLCLGKDFTDFKLIKHNYIGDKQFIEFIVKNKKYSFSTSLLGKVQIKNLMMAIMAAHNSNIKLEKIIKSIDKIKSVNGRLEEVVKFKNNSRVILDYAHTPDALKACLESLTEQFKFNKISIVFGCGGDRDKPKRKIMGQIANEYCHKIYLTDDNPRTENPDKIRSQIKQNINKNKLKEIPSRKIAISEAIKDLGVGEILLVAGKGHENYQEYKLRKSFSDKKHILKNKNLKNETLSNDWKLNILDEKLKNKKLNKNININYASINSREINKNDIFFSIRGKKFDGNKFANEAIQKGASLSIIDKNFDIKSKKKIKVKNSFKFLNECAKSIRNVSLIKAISITGSSGKTSLKDLLSFCLNKLAPTTKSTQSFNNKFGVPLSLFNVKKNDKFAVLEAGMDKAGEIDNLTKIIKPNFGIITNISYAHIKNFKNLDGIARAKSEIINNIVAGGKIILNQDDEYFYFLKKIALKKNIHVISFSKKNTFSDIFVKKITTNKTNYKILINIKNLTKGFLIKKNLYPYLYNILASLAVISEFYDLKNISEKLFYNFKLPFSRGDITKVRLKNKVIYLTDESYNSNPLSLKFAIENFNKQNQNNKYLILGDMLELGKFSKKLHKKISKIINKTSIKKVYVVGKHVKETFYSIDKKKRGRILLDKKEIYQLIKNDLNNNDHLMIKASNSTGLNNIAANIKKGKIYAI